MGDRTERLSQGEKCSAHRFVHRHRRSRVYRVDELPNGRRADERFREPRLNRRGCKPCIDGGSERGDCHLTNGRDKRSCDLTERVNHWSDYFFNRLGHRPCDLVDQLDHWGGDFLNWLDQRSRRLCYWLDERARRSTNGFDGPSGGLYHRLGNILNMLYEWVNLFNQWPSDLGALVGYRLSNLARLVDMLVSHQ